MLTLSIFSFCHYSMLLPRVAIGNASLFSSLFIYLYLSSLWPQLMTAPDANVIVTMVILSSWLYRNQNSFRFKITYLLILLLIFFYFKIQMPAQFNDWGFLLCMSSCLQFPLNRCCMHTEM